MERRTHCWMACTQRCLQTLCRQGMREWQAPPRPRCSKHAVIASKGHDQQNSGGANAGLSDKHTSIHQNTAGMRSGHHTREAASKPATTLPHRGPKINHALAKQIKSQKRPALSNPYGTAGLSRQPIPHGHAGAASTAGTGCGDGQQQSTKKRTQQHLAAKVKQMPPPSFPGLQHAANPVAS